LVVLEALVLAAAFVLEAAALGAALAFTALAALAAAAASAIGATTLSPPAVGSAVQSQVPFSRAQALPEAAFGYVTVLPS
jgi:hypothetical protein